MFQVAIYEEICIGCGEYVDICPNEVLEIVNEKALPVEGGEECVGCESCVEVCEQEAIPQKKYNLDPYLKIFKQIFRNFANFLNLRLNPPV
jgi:ferredoxin